MEVSLNPLKRVNSILTQGWALPEFGAILDDKSQSPQTGQFNSYVCGFQNKG